MVAHPAAGAAIDGAALIEQAFSDATGLPTQIFVARDYAALIDAQTRGRIDYGVYSAAAYATARLACGCVEPIAAPITSDGSTGISAVLIKRRGGSGAAGVVATVPGDVTAWLAAARPGRDPDSERSLSTASEAEAMFASGEAGAIVGWMPHRPVGAARDGGTFSRLVAAGLAPDDLEIAWRSEPVRFGPHAVRTDMPEKVRSALTLFLITLHDVRPEVFQHIEPLRQGGFARVADSDYETARAMVTRLAQIAPGR
jgi:phosphonate transport system substrate-binding protein